MLYKLSITQENDLLNQPETGMGYQIVEASKNGSYKQENFLILNSEIVIEMNGYEGENVRKVISEGIMLIKASASLISLNVSSVLNEKQYRSIIAESTNENEKGAIDNQVEFASGEELFVRLSAFENDKRIDRIKGCLLPGSYTTTNQDYKKCKEVSDDPIERYALPNNETIKFAFYIHPLKSDTLQRGTVQPANDKRGGGKEVYFANGTATGTFIDCITY